MTREEFQLEYNRLKMEFPQNFSSAGKRDLIAIKVLSLSQKWFQKLVDRMILSSNPRLDIDDAARSERILQDSLRLEKDISGARENISREMSERGLQNILESFGAKSLLEAVEKARLMKNG